MSHGPKNAPLLTQLFREWRDFGHQILHINLLETGRLKNRDHRMGFAVGQTGDVSAVFLRQRNRRAAQPAAGIQDPAARDRIRNPA